MSIQKPLRHILMARSSSRIIIWRRIMKLQVSLIYSRSNWVLTLRIGDKVTGQEAATIQEESLTNSPTLDAINSRESAHYVFLYQHTDLSHFTLWLVDPQLASGRPTNPPTDSTVPSAVVHQSAPVDLPDQVKPRKFCLNYVSYVHTTRAHVMQQLAQGQMNH